MLKAKSVALTGNPQSLQDILGLQDEIRGGISLTLEASGAAVRYGTKEAQPLTIAAGERLDHLHGINAKELYVHGTGATLNILANYT